MTAINSVTNPATVNSMTNSVSASKPQALSKANMTTSEVSETKLSYLDELKSQQVKKATDEQRKTGDGQQLTQKDFLSILTKQLAQQDPSNPVSNDQMIAQMASFATVDGIGKMNSNFESLNATMTSSQALQASTLVGQDVLIRESIAMKTAEGGVGAIATLPNSVENLTVRIEDSVGQLVKTLNMGKKQAGDERINWDGKDDQGNLLPEGRYTVKATGLMNGKNESIPISTYANVESVLLGKGDGNVMLNLSGHQKPVKLSEALQVGKIDQKS